MKKQLEIQRSNVTIGEFFTAIRSALKRNGMDFSEMASAQSEVFMTKPLNFHFYVKNFDGSYMDQFQAENAQKLREMVVGMFNG